VFGIRHVEEVAARNQSADCGDFRGIHGRVVARLKAWYVVRLTRDPRDYEVLLVMLTRSVVQIIAGKDGGLEVLI